MPPGDELAARIRKWVVGVMRMLGSIPRSAATFSISNQLADSAGSTGANFVEARAARSHKEFISTVGIAEKESKESIYWLTLLQDLGLGDQNEVERLLKEGDEIASILTAIGRNAKINAQ